MSNTYTQKSSNSLKNNQYFFNNNENVKISNYKNNLLKNAMSVSPKKNNLEIDYAN